MRRVTLLPPFLNTIAVHWGERVLFAVLTWRTGELALLPIEKNISPTQATNLSPHVAISFSRFLRRRSSFTSTENAQIEKLSENREEVDAYVTVTVSKARSIASFM